MPPLARPPFRLSLPMALTLVLAGSLAPGQDRGRTTSEINDGAGMFSDAGLRRARSDLAEVERKYRVPVVIETIESLRGQTIDEVAVRRAEQLDFKGIFVLIAKQDHKLEAIAARPIRDELGRDRLHAIRDAISREFRNQNLDAGLLKGVQAASAALAEVRSLPVPRGREPEPTPAGGTTSGSSSSSSLVHHGQVRLNLAGARKAMAGAEAKAAQEGWKMNLAVVDDGGHLLAFARMDGARPASVATATTKAVSAATYRMPTGPLPGTPAGKEPDLLLNLSIQNAAADSGGKVTSLLGGLPIVVDGQVIGALGVGGGTGEQDAEVAKAGVTAFLAGLQAPAPAAEEAKPKPIDQPRTPASSDDARPGKPKVDDRIEITIPRPDEVGKLKPGEVEASPK